MADYQLPPWQFKPGHQMEVAETGELSYLYFPAFRAYPKLRHGFSTRQGGVSEGYLGTMNFSFDRGDDPEHVRENYRRIAAALGVSYDSLTVAKQTHTSNVKEITMAERGAGVRFPRPYDNVDGIMTNVPGITLVTYHADCLPVYLYDPAHQAIALLHAGWRGTVDNIVSAGLLKMQKAYGTRASDVIAGIGPGISAACYETSEGYESCLPRPSRIGTWKASLQTRTSARTAHGTGNLTLRAQIIYCCKMRAYRRFLTAVSVPIEMRSVCFRTAPKG